MRVAQNDPSSPIPSTPDARPVTRFFSPLVGGRQLVRGIGQAMHANEESLHVAIEPALANLIGIDLDEGVMTSLWLHDDLRRAELAAERARPLSRGLSREAERRKELV